MDNVVLAVALAEKGEMIIKPSLLLKLCGWCSGQPRELKSVSSRWVPVHGSIRS